MNTNGALPAQTSPPETESVAGRMKALKDIVSKRTHIKDDALREVTLPFTKLNQNSFRNPGATVLHQHSRT